MARDLIGAARVVEALDKSIKTPEGINITRGNSAAINDYDAYTTVIRNFGSKIVDSVRIEQELDDFEFIDGTEEDYSKTMITTTETLFTPSTDEFDKSFVIEGGLVENSQEELKEKLSNLDFSELEKVSEGELVEQILVQQEKEHEEEKEEVKTNEKVKTLTKNNKAAYVDTVILCLVAQLSIFGLLIIVLLIIK